MQAFTTVDSVLIPLDRANVDTDAIIPKQFLKTIERQGLGKFLFFDWRYRNGNLGEENPDFVLNDPRYRGAQVLLTRQNFGCGSSREHAPWALADYGIRAIIAPSFADIFANNCVQNGILLISLPQEQIDSLFAATQTEPVQVHIDLAAEELRLDSGRRYAFSIAPGAKHKLLHGLDDIELTLGHAAAIRAYEQQRRQQMPWLFREEARHG
ncbi:3-isopropylmalate dehydratase small subunit [Candidatus Igneacidithiobacillus taiwanensis]|uniref:3-isopropylmalate dehydratase small subunit n=1 Tax=Candidatus Igneacidithiobacillus taiwanensis TaxID=1945924 RepID=UPI00289E8CE5|nr:3-isopropylmalate dehydratase small subunit [Candidatus Igneacidithiobacillus taiwanensis]MCE5360499.1 3-isopropylmalate dehydratase small subunit [Acidithiobacillus sp.]